MTRQGVLHGLLTSDLILIPGLFWELSTASVIAFTIRAGHHFLFIFIQFFGSLVSFTPFFFVKRDEILAITDAIAVLTFVVAILV